MARKSPRKRGGRRRSDRQEVVTVPTKTLSDAVETMTKEFEKVRQTIAKLPPKVQKKETNVKALASLARSLRQLQAIDLLVTSTLCCDVQIQNCEFTIES